LLVAVIPEFKLNNAKKVPDVLKVELVQPKPPKPVVIPEPPKPVEQIKSAPEPIKPLPKKELKPEPMPVQDIKPEPAPAEPVPPPAVITATPKVDAPPVITVPPPPPEPPKKIEPSQDDISAARGAYIQNVENELKRNHRYPRAAIQRGIQGAVKVKIIIDNEGAVVAATVLEPSGNNILDEAAISTVNRSNLKQFYPEILRGRDYEFNTLIKFTLTNP
jgi:protein TonB